MTKPLVTTTRIYEHRRIDALQGLSGISTPAPTIEHTPNAPKMRVACELIGSCWNLSTTATRSSANRVKNQRLAQHRLRQTLNPVRLYGYCVLSSKIGSAVTIADSLTASV
ncbi:MAG TPA: hypothetical protein VHV31_05720, partial [Nitrolancea sp.]|nr:hypothetical protein [Nitrolancea sp.]